MIQYFVTNVASGLVTNTWTSDFADGTYYEPCFGQQAVAAIPAVAAQDAVLDSDGNVITPAVAAQPAVPAVPAAYTITQVDITAQLARAAAVAQAQAYLTSTDWMIIRQIDNGVAVPADVKTQRQAARAVIAPNGVSVVETGA